MQYISTRDREQQFSAAQAISKGLADDGGLLTPVYLPKLPRRSLELSLIHISEPTRPY